MAVRELGWDRRGLPQVDQGDARGVAWRGAGAVWAKEIEGYWGEQLAMHMEWRGRAAGLLGSAAAVEVGRPARHACGRAAYAPG